MIAQLRGWVVDVIVGGGIGLVFGWIAAGNAASFLGAEGGYEMPPELFETPVVAVIVLTLFVAGPVIGIVIARRIRADLRRGSR